MTRKNITVAPSGDGNWNVERAGRTLSTHRTQGTAIQKARPIARKNETELVIKGRDGKIRRKDSYGNDPRRLRDTEH